MEQHLANREFPWRQTSWNSHRPTPYELPLLQTTLNAEKEEYFHSQVDTISSLVNIAATP